MGDDAAQNVGAGDGRDQSVVIDMTKPGAIEHFRLCQVIACLRIEVRTGMRHSQGSVVKVLKGMYPKGKVPDKKQAALHWAEDKYEELYGRRYGA